MRFKICNSNFNRRNSSCVRFNICNSNFNRRNSSYVHFKICNSNFNRKNPSCAFQNLQLGLFRLDTWLPVQPSVALETYLEEVKIQLAEIKIDKPKNNLPVKERQAIKELKENKEINIKRADKGSTTVILNKKDKIHEGKAQLDDEENYKPLETPMVIETARRVKELVV